MCYFFFASYSELNARNYKNNDVINLHLQEINSLRKVVKIQNFCTKLSFFITLAHY